MTPEQIKYLLATEEQILNTVLNIHAESRATKEMVILLAKANLSFPEKSAEATWQMFFDAAFEKLGKDSRDAIVKQL